MWGQAFTSEFTPIKQTSKTRVGATSQNAGLPEHQPLHKNTTKICSKPPVRFSSRSNCEGKKLKVIQWTTALVLKICGRFFIFVKETKFEEYVVRGSTSPASLRACGVVQRRRPFSGCSLQCPPQSVHQTRPRNRQPPSLAVDK